MNDAIPIVPVDGPVTGTIRPPGSKSLTNRALLVAALAEGRSRLEGVLESIDTRVMIEGLRRLGIDIDWDKTAASATLAGGNGRFPTSAAELDLVNSGTSIRFLTAACAAAGGNYRLDGNPRMRQRPIQDLLDALVALGATAEAESSAGCPPVLIGGTGLAGGNVTVAGNVSSQYLSALLMAAPLARKEVRITLAGELVSVPYVEMTLRVMEHFGAVVQREQDGFRIAPQFYSGTNFTIEPDASAASYFMALAAITGGRVVVQGLTRQSIQGDVAFVDALVRMGCRLEEGADSLALVGGDLRGITIDMNAISDTAQTLAAVAVFAEGPTTIRHIAHVRHKETDRIAALATELRRLGQDVEEYDDGLTIEPRPVTPARVETYDDHRMAMSLALVGLRVPGIVISDPGCTAKTYPSFWDDLARLRGRKSVKTQHTNPKRKRGNTS